MNNDYWDKKIDLGLKRKALGEKFGMVFSSINKELRPELEDEWLNHIEKFEEQWANQKTTTVWEFLGKPKYKLLQELSNDAISSALNALLELMQIQGISLDTLSEVEDHELYRFITEELFNCEIDDMHIPGMQHCFIYEEFHPNARLEVEQAYDYFLTMTLAKTKNISGDGYDLLYIDTANYQSKHSKILKPAEVERQLKNFLDSFDFFSVEQHHIIEIDINSEKTNALLEFEIEYQGCFNHNTETVLYKGIGKFKLHPGEYGGWSIYNIDMPGLSV